MTVMNKDAPATKGDLDTSFEDMRGYVDTAVGTLTVEMDRQFKEVRGDIKHLQDDVTNDQRRCEGYQGKLARAKAMTNEPKIDFKVLDAAIKKVLAFKPKKKLKPAK